jgi:hypothetical protein
MTPATCLQTVWPGPWLIGPGQLALQAATAALSFAFT